MRRLTSRLGALAAAGVGAAAIAAVASGQVVGGTVELGATKTGLVAPVCPSNVSSTNCTIILTRVTALATNRDGVSYPTRVKHAGRITSFTVGLSQLSSTQSTQSSEIQYLNGTYGGPARIGITILRKGPWKRGQFRWTVVAASPMYLVPQSYLGSVVEIPLTNTLAVKSGEAIALTTPTWAPVLSIDLNSKQFSYRQSRVYNCPKPPSSNQAQLTAGKVKNYGCNYPGTRPEYTATEVLYPFGNKPAS
jgi:hypothetical protein